MAIIVVGIYLVCAISMFLGMGINWTVGVIFAGVGIPLVSIFSILPLQGYKKPEVNTINLLALKTVQKDNEVYFLKTKDKTVTFAKDSSNKYEISSVVYEEYELTKNVKIYEVCDCKKPVLKEVITRPVRDFYTFSNFFTKKEYLFYVPVGTILKNGNENSKSNDITKNSKL